MLNIPHLTNKLAALTGINSQPDSFAKDEFLVCSPTLFQSLTTTIVKTSQKQSITSSANSLTSEFLLF